MSNPRQIAADVLHELNDSNRTLDFFLDRSDEKFQKLKRADRALARALIFGVLRWQGRIDWILGRLLRRPNKKLDSWVHIALRLGLFQLLFLDRIPASAAVNTTVNLVKENNRKWAAGFVNGVLREAIRSAPTLSMPDITDSPVQALAIRYAFPQWLIGRWVDRFGTDTTQSLCRAINQVPAITLRTNTLKTTRSELIDTLHAEVKSLQKTEYSPHGVRCTSVGGAIETWPSFKSGWFQVQSEAAQLIAYYLDPKPGERVWDACAGLGTKTAHLAQLMYNTGRLLASDHEPSKLDKLSKEMQRLGVQCVETRCLDLEKAEQLHSTAKFDRILVDAPCSGLGVLGKNPDGKWRTSEADIYLSARRQYTILRNVSAYLRPGGIMVYAVCSTEPEENELLVQRFLQKHPEFGIHRLAATSIADSNNFITPEGFLQTLPHLNHMDGFFAAAFKRGSTP